MNSLYLKIFSILLLFSVTSAWGCKRKTEDADVQLSYSSITPKVIVLDLPSRDDGVGGIVTVDINRNLKRDFVITRRGFIAAYDHLGTYLWRKQVDIQVTEKSESFGLPGWHGPGVQASDIDGDGEVEILFLTQDNALHVVKGATGTTKKRIRLKSPPGTDGWEHLIVANFRGEGDRDLLLQTTNNKGYRMGRYLAAYSLEDLVRNADVNPLWTQNQFAANAHNGARVADLDGDGKDEVLGGTIIGQDGRIMLQVPINGHIDSIFVADIRSDIQGLEVVALEEGGRRRIFPNSNRIFRICNRMVDRLFPAGDHVFLYNYKQLIWKSHYQHWEPQNAAIGDFDPKLPGLEIWCRSRFDEHQKPFVLDAKGRTIANYQMDNVAPKDWTIKGVEVIFTIDWTGGPKQLLAAKERHKSGDVAILDPISGQFLHRFKERADRLYVADVYGDWREEVIVLNGNQLRIYMNNEPNLNTDHASLWDQNHYRRSKMTWNYYSP